MIRDIRHAAEVERIAAEYRDRDERSRSVNPTAQSARLLHVQDLEWQVIRSLRSLGASLAGATVLDVGSGSGLLLHRLVEVGAARGVGVDLMDAGGSPPGARDIRNSSCWQRTPRIYLSETATSTQSHTSPA